MDYKKAIPSAVLRRRILDCLRFVPDSVMLPLQYRMKLGRSLNGLPDGKCARYTEKLQWYKVHYRNPLMHICVDKYKVREFVYQMGLGGCLVPLLGKYESINTVEWDSLPEAFVAKTTHGGGGHNVVVCLDKSKLNFREIEQKLDCSSGPVLENTMGREWAYYGLKPGIVIEKLLLNRKDPAAGIMDYKFFCFGGKAEYIVVDTDRYTAHKRNFYDRTWNDMHVGSDCPQNNGEIPKPDNFAEMISVAEKLSAPFPHVRVDLYNVDGKIYFGELTFYPWSGYVQFVPDEFDYVLGERFALAEYESAGKKT